MPSLNGTKKNAEAPATKTAQKQSPGGQTHMACPPLLVGQRAATKHYSSVLQWLRLRRVQEPCKSKRKKKKDRLKEQASKDLQA